MKCLRCQTDNPEGSGFCRKCGQSLRIEVSCQKCGHTNLPDSTFCNQCGNSLNAQAIQPSTGTARASPSQPTSFANGRYQVKKFLGEGGKKKVYLAHDAVLDRDVAFALIKTEKLDETALTRIKREAQAMARLGDHPHIMSIYDLGDQQGQPFIVLPIMSGGDVEGLIKKAPEHKLPLEQAISIAIAVCQGLVFAHAKGIVHRDIKPGNVWLSEDGTVKIGDFGLAVALDLSRLTQHGMMVGTVSYMPPEQAMGGEVTAKADLYSLGAMLYEMVTGRPPFVGDDSVAIIGQHINTPPVSPTWHRAELPPALETLILQLLEKDPARRPQSASDVLKILESVEAGKVKAITPTEIPAPSAASPLYRRVFVGREAELKQLQSAFDSAISGQGSLMMVVGEPGIGKTATCEQLATYVALRGGKTLVGHCYEKGSLSLPYLGFVEALRSYVISRDSQELRKELGTAAADVARIVSEIREKLKVKPKGQGDPDEERYRLMQAVTSFLTHAATVHPLMLVLEDLHDADKGTIDMLTHLSRNLANTRLLIVGTYRDVEVDRNHPLSAALAELRRVSTYGRVLLRGLNADEVRRMLEAIAAQEVPWGLAEAVHRQTEGNPLFVQEVVRYLHEEGFIKREDGQWKGKTETQLAMSIPEGLRDVIGKRLSLLSQECNQLLSIASVIGREFSLETLRTVAGIPEEAFVNALREAVHLSILEERSQVGTVRYRFTHAFFRQTLYEEMIAPQRLQLHQQVARTLEKQFAHRLEEHAAELAEHFSQSTDRADLAKAVAYGEMAAKRAIDVYAFGEAVRLLEQAVKVQKVLDPDAKAKVCDLLLTLGDALGAAGEPKRAFGIVLEEAFVLAENMADKNRCARACSLAMVALILHGSGLLASWATPESARWVERADRSAGPDSVARVWADIGAGETKQILSVAKAPPDFALAAEGAKTIRRALELAGRLADPESFWFAHVSWLLRGSMVKDIEERRRVAVELRKRSRAGVSAFTTSGALILGGWTLLESGQREAAEECLKEAIDLTEHTGQVHMRLMSAVANNVILTMNGRLEEAVAAGYRSLALSQDLGLEAFGFAVLLTGMSTPMVYLGKADEAVNLLGPSRLPLAYSLAHPVFLSQVDQNADQIKELLNGLLETVSGRSYGAEEFLTPYQASYLEAAVLVEHRPAVELLSRVFSDSRQKMTGLFIPVCVARYRGRASAFLERYDEARQHYQEAIAVCSEMRHRPELALSRLQLAELLLGHYPDEKKDALEHLHFAIKEFTEMKMQPSLERALRQKKILKA